MVSLLEMDNKNIIYQELIYKNMLLMMEEIFMIIQSKVILKNTEN